ncbi:MULTISPECIES: tRNA epoxyqueuosine(34) reductase QueG [unclassified Prochlorococcus]|uniref:tRNA epoxyqueuosine(34) reductase QueG n=1 Tax=unclassified Prochlorococcus TaxID=2627481 RepID=UPI00053392F4|nr:MULTISPECIES: tRNA epoxyqueuosine(34) reductase QueG [unclassified Prochlorococcus]KGG14490.1 Epoxyqueuosine (oQ) reductase QueG [Prochlorococcus sp. MIT 0602]KGG16085.1 Epoxyqueuosine (oQ) reductase QueG [Prochlorococcus sp. MIT 0603]
MASTQDQLSTELKIEAQKFGFNPVGIARIPGSERIKMRNESLERWINAGHHADMQWIKSPARLNPEILLKDVKSVLVVGLNYFTIPKNKNAKTALIGRYAWGNDYHKVIEKRLKKIGKWLEEERPNAKWKICVDSKPLLEKAWAEEAGLGWIGKNSNLINSKQGSWMVLGSLLTTEELTADKPSISLCGKCQKCIDSCPTQAISEPFVINSRKCIAYHNIENRNKDIPKEIQKYMGNWIAGCDICQEECPWNQKELPTSQDPDTQAKEWILKLTAENAVKLNDEKWKKQLQGSSLKRIKPWMWRRNANYILKNTYSNNKKSQ